MHILQQWSLNKQSQPPAVDFRPYRLEQRQAYFEQERIGFDMFVKGLLTPKWSKIQEKYILHEELPSNYNIERWKKKVSEILLLHCVSCYKERCTIIAAETKSAHEQHIRHKAMELLQDVKNNKWKITHDVSHLTDRTANFFEYGNITNITEWTKNMTTAIERSMRRTKENACNLEKFF